MSGPGPLKCELHNIEWDKNYSGPRCPLCVQEEITSLVFEEMDRVKSKLDAWRQRAAALEGLGDLKTTRIRLEDLGELPQK